MAVTYIGEQHWGREGEIVPMPEAGEQTYEGGQIQGPQNGRYSRMFMVTTTATTEGVRDVIAAVPVQLGQTYPADANSICTRLRAVNLREHWKTWNVFAEYTRPTPEVYQVSYGSERSEIVPKVGKQATNPGSQNEVFARADGITTSAGEEFDPPPTVPKFQPVITISLIRPTFDAAKQKKFLGAINSQPVPLNNVVYGARTLMVTRYEGQRITTGEMARKWQVSISLLVNEDTHRLYLFDYGTKYYATAADKAAGRVSVFRGKDDGQIKKRLDGGGMALADNAEDVFLEYLVYREEDFNGALL